MTSEQVPGKKKVEPVPIASGQMAIALASIRNTEASLRWQGAQWVIALNLSALVAMLYRLITGPEMPELSALVVCCVVATVLNIEWGSVLRRDGKLFEFWNKKFAEHEKKNGIEGGAYIFTSSEYRQ